MNEHLKEMVEDNQHIFDPKKHTTLDDFVNDLKSELEPPKQVIDPYPLPENITFRDV